ncbi:MAG: circadian clock protein KaiB [Desulfobacteraceae bacterium IS3]|nr:MAG: circadian clock protein KaiB [Desulfobacteraceae bacterium IS3]
MIEFEFKLYIAGKTRRSNSAISNIRQICDTDLHGNFRLTIIDVLENPEAAEQRKILATPMLIKESPPPARYLIGDLSNREKVLTGLEIEPTY